MTLKNFRDIFGTKVDVIPVKLDLLNPYSKHDYTPYSEEKMNHLVESIKKYGVIQPAIVRVINGEYEILAGHNRKEGSRRAGLDSLDCIVLMDCDDDMAQAIVDDTNLLQRSFEELPISVASKIIHDYHERNKNQGVRTDLDEESEGATEKIMNEYYLSPSSIQRYLRLYRLSNQFKEVLDSGVISKRVGEEFSYLDLNIQNQLYDLLYDWDCFSKLKEKNAREIKNYIKEIGFDEDQIMEIITPTKPIPFDFNRLEENLSQRFGKKVTVKEKSMTIKYSNSEELKELLANMELDDEIINIG